MEIKFKRTIEFKIDIVTHDMLKTNEDVNLFLSCAKTELLTRLIRCGEFDTEDFKRIRFFKKPYSEFEKEKAISYLTNELVFKSNMTEWGASRKANQRYEELNPFNLVVEID